MVDAKNDSFTTHSNVPLINNASDLLPNDTFSNGDKAVTSVTQPTNGTLSYVNGVLTYTPNRGFVGTDSYIYTVTSGGVTERATVTINVTNLAPIVAMKTRPLTKKPRLGQCFNQRPRPRWSDTLSREKLHR